MVMECEVGPCMLGGIAAEAQAPKKKTSTKKVLKSPGTMHAGRGIAAEG